MGAAVMFGRDLDVLEANVPVRIFVLNANVRKMHLVVEVRQLVLTGPGCDLGLAPVRSAVAVVIAAIAFLEKALVIAFQLAVQLHTLDARALIVQALGCLPVRPIELRVVAALAWAIGARMEPLTVVSIADAMSFEERTAPVCESDGTFLVIHRNTLDEPVLFKVTEVALADVAGRITRVA